jgi:hypothetical protein
MKYCNRCGANLITPQEPANIQLIEKRMDSEMEGLFWVTMLGLGLILGGVVAMKKVQLNEWLIIAYMVLSSAAFVTYFLMCVWQIRRLAKRSDETKGFVGVAPSETGELNPPTIIGSLEAAPSVTDHTTRTLEPVPRERVPRSK